MFIVHVHVHVKEGCEQAFREASILNSRASVSTEPGVARFDVIEETADPRRFVLVEVYHSDDAAAAHKETAHYQTWRDTVAEMMAEDRRAVKYGPVNPVEIDGWASASPH
ncbi:MAG: putative quinol monooxygenase [Verrucomicrobiota bacterium]